MKTTCSRWGIASGVLAVALLAAPLAMAAQGDTSGPAAGKPTTPSTAVQKNASDTNGTSAAGAPGVSGKGGAESGSKPDSPSGSSTNR